MNCDLTMENLKIRWLSQRSMPSQMEPEACREVFRNVECQLRDFTMLKMLLHRF